MSIRDAAASVSAAVLQTTGDPLTLIPPGGADEIETMMLLSRIGVRLDPKTGMTVQGDQTAITFTMPAELPDETWRVRFLDSRGVTVEGMIAAVAPDRSLNRITAFCKVSASA